MLQGSPLNTNTSIWKDWFLPYFFTGKSYAPPKAIVPRPVLELTTKKMLVSEWIFLNI